MFALEIDFKDGISSSEILLVRRLCARIGASDMADVVIDSAMQAEDIVVRRGVGRDFTIHLAEDEKIQGGQPSFSEGTYSGEASIKIGGTCLRIVALDCDLYGLSTLSTNVSIDVFKAAIAHKPTRYPAVAVLGEAPIFASVQEDSRLLVGRSRKCSIRLDASDVADEHVIITGEGARLYVEKANPEALVWLDSAVLAEKTSWKSSQIMHIGKHVALVPIYDDADLARIGEKQAKTEPVSDQNQVWRISSASENVKPSQYEAAPGQVVTIGRDPTNDIWVGAPHISRHHVELHIHEGGKVSIKDLSSNGTFVGTKRLVRGELDVLSVREFFIDLKEGVTLSVSCVYPHDSHDYDIGAEDEDVTNDASSDRQEMDFLREELAKRLQIRSETDGPVFHENSALNDSISIGEDADRSREIRLSSEPVSAEEIYGDYNGFDTGSGLVRSSQPIFVGLIVVLSAFMSALAVWLFSAS